MTTVHADLSPALALEERIAWSAVINEFDEIEDALASAVKGLHDALRTGLAAWAGQAVARLPAESFATSAGQTLRLLASETDRETGSQSSQTSPAQVIATLPDARLGIARRGTLLILGAVAGSAGFALPVPDTEPLMVEVLRQGEDERLLRIQQTLSGDQLWRIEVGRARVQLVNALDEVFDVPGFADWSGGGADYRRFELHHGQHEGLGEG